MALPHYGAVCKIYQRCDDPVQTMCVRPFEPLPDSTAWRYIGSRRVDDWSQHRRIHARPGARIDEFPAHIRKTVTPDHLSRMQRPDLRKRPKYASLLQKQLYDLKNRSTLKPGELPPLPPRADEEPRTRLLSPKHGWRVQEGPLTFWGPDANPQSFHT
jgi:hypothetical protein